MRSLPAARRGRGAHGAGGGVHVASPLERSICHLPSLSVSRSGPVAARASASPTATTPTSSSCFTRTYLIWGSLSFTYHSARTRETARAHCRNALDIVRYAVGSQPSTKIWPADWVVCSCGCGELARDPSAVDSAAAASPAAGACALACASRSHPLPGAPPPPAPAPAPAPTPAAVPAAVPVPAAAASSSAEARWPLPRSAILRSAASRSPEEPTCLGGGLRVGLEAKRPEPQPEPEPEPEPKPSLVGPYYLTT